MRALNNVVLVMWSLYNIMLLLSLREHVANNLRNHHAAKIAFVKIKQLLI